MPSTPTLPEWERVLSAAAHLQRILPDAVLVGGTAAAIYAGHRLSTDADHVLTDLRIRFDVVLAELESVSGWTTARVARPVLVLGSLDGIETGVRQLIRTTPLETQRLEVVGGHVTVPTAAEILRIKGVLILRRNATRDYLDFVALSDHLGTAAFVESLRPFTRSPAASRRCINFRFSSPARCPTTSMTTTSPSIRTSRSDGMTGTLSSLLLRSARRQSSTTSLASMKHRLCPTADQAADTRLGRSHVLMSVKPLLLLAGGLGLPDKPKYPADPDGESGFG